MNTMICVGKKGTEYVYVNLSTWAAHYSNELSDKTFNEERYMTLKKENDVVYTVLNEIHYNVEYNSLLGYIIATDNGDVDVILDTMLFAMVKENAFLNYSIATRKDKEFVKKVRGTHDVPVVEDALVKQYLGFNTYSYNLSNHMTMEELDYCMKKNDFVLAYHSVSEMSYYSWTKPCHFFVYYNHNGVQIRLNAIQESNTMYDFSYYNSSMIAMCHIPNREYSDFRDKVRFSLGSLNPIDGINTDITLFSFNRVSDFMRVSHMLPTYFEACMPYYVSNELEAFTTLLFSSQVQIEKDEELVKSALSNSFDVDNLYCYTHFIQMLVGFYNVKSCENDFKAFYSDFFGKDTFTELTKDCRRLARIPLEDRILMEKSIKSMIENKKL